MSMSIGFYKAYILRYKIIYEYLSSSFKGFSVKLSENASHTHLFRNTISCHKTSQHYFEPLQMQPGGHDCEGPMGSDIMPIDK